MVVHDDTYMGGHSENNIKCVVHDDFGWKNQTSRYILPRHWLYEWFSQFRVVELILFFRGALQLYYRNVCKNDDAYLNFVRQPSGKAGPEKGRRKSGGADSGSQEVISKLLALWRMDEEAAAASGLIPVESKLSVESNDRSAETWTERSLRRTASSPAVSGRRVIPAKPMHNHFYNCNALQL